jgi:DNA-binding NarL/FixJ family response regulator
MHHAAQHNPGCDALVVTMLTDDAHVLGSIEAGATGCLLKVASAARITAAIHEVREGGSPLSPSIARRVLARFRSALLTSSVCAAMPPAASAPPAEASPLSECETELLRLIAKGFSLDAVAEVLCLSPHTVVTYVKNIYRKLAVHSRGEAVHEARQMGLL